jgi:hypothetical protein
MGFFMHILKLLPVLSLALLTGACASLVKGQTQNVTLLTPGASKARCTFDNGVRYVAETGETIKVMRNEKDIVVDCYALGNRHRKINIKSDGSDWAIGNIATGVIPGVTFDHFSKGLYEYPEIITVDFRGIPTLGHDTPDYHNADAANPYEQPMESYGASSARLPTDGNIIKTPARRKFSNEPVTSVPSTGKDRTAEQLTRSMNPGIFNYNH